MYAGNLYCPRLYCFRVLPLLLQIQAMAAVQDEMGPKSVTVLVTWDANDHGGNVHFEVSGLLPVCTIMCLQPLYQLLCSFVHITNLCDAHMHPRVTLLHAHSTHPVYARN